jgi:hypothetical protein
MYDVLDFFMDRTHVLLMCIACEKVYEFWFILERTKQ